MNILNSWREPVNALTHLIALIIFTPILILLIYLGYNKGGLEYAIPLLIFTISVICVYGASSIYHMINAPEKTILLLKKVDHMMIFVLIAGTYTPICVLKLEPSISNIILTVVWSIGLIGILIKLLWINAPRWLSTMLYVLMGWSALMCVKPIYNAVPLDGFLLLIFGGIVYTIGAVIYAFKKPNFNIKYFGFHEIFHIFIIIGSLCYIIFMFKYII